MSACVVAQMTHLLRLFLFLQCKHVLRMAGKISMGSNHSTLNNVTIDTGVKGMQGKATEKLQY